MAKKTTQELSNLIPSKIDQYGHHGNFTIVKRSNEKFLAYYPFESDRQIPTVKGKSIHSCLKKMVDELSDRKIIVAEVVKKKKRKRKFTNKVSVSSSKNPMSDKERRKIKLRIQNKNLRNK